MPPAETTFVDSNGAPLASGFVYFYVPGTTTTKPTWQDPNGLVPNSNPVQLNSAGRAIIYGSGQYREIVQDQFGNTIWDQLTQDPISAARGALGTMAQQNANAVSITGGSISGVTLSGLSGIRTVLSGPTIFYLSPSGVDQPSCATTSSTANAASPCKTPAYVRNYVQNTYDTGGNQVTFSLAAGTYSCPPFLNGPLVGQTGGTNGSDELWQGAGSSQTFIYPQGTGCSGYAFGMNSGARAEITEMTLAMPNSDNAPNDTINLGNAGTVLTIGPDVTFGQNLFPYNDITAAFGAMVIVTGNVTLNKPSVSTTASWSAGGDVLTVASATGIKPYMGVVGTGLGYGLFVLSTNGNQITVSYGAYTPNALPPSPGSNVPVTFLSGGNAFLSTSAGAQAYFNTNGNSSLALQIISNAATYYQTGFFEATDNSSIIAQAITFAVNTPANYGLPFLTQSNGVIDTNFVGVPYAPGLVGCSTTATGSAGSNQITVGANCGIQVGNAVNVATTPNSSFSQGASSITVTSSTGVTQGNSISGTCGIAGGTAVASVIGTTVTLSTPTIASCGGAGLWIKGTGIPNGTYVTGISGTTITLSQNLTASISSYNVVFGGIVRGGQYD